MVSQGEVESPLQTEQDQSNNDNSSNSNGFQQSPEERQTQTSIYNLTLEEFQNSLSDGGKNVGSMNMDEFLTSIWNAEENQTQNQCHLGENDDNNGTNFAQNGIEKQLTLVRQGSFSIPELLCRKTVDEIWSEINRTEQSSNHNNVGVIGQENCGRRVTYGKMTLEEFLVQAGIVTEKQGNNCNCAAQSAVVAGSVPFIGGGASVGVSAYYHPQPSPQGGVLAAPPGCGGGIMSGFSQPQSIVYGGQMQGLGVGSPANGHFVNQWDEESQFGSEVEARGGRKRNADGVVVVERRQRRMIKNRESAARSRARKLAYTLELEAELNHLKEDNARLKKALEEMERQIKQEFEEEKLKAHTEIKNAKELKGMRRCLSCPF